MKRYSKKTPSTYLKHSITIKSKVKVSDGEGGFDETLKNISNVFASVDPLKAEKKAELKSINVDATHLIKVRGYTIISENDIIYFNDREFEVLTIENIQERDFLKFIYCKERR